MTDKTQEKNEHVPTIDQLADRVVDWMDEAARSDTYEMSKRYRESARNALLELIDRKIADALDRWGLD